MGKIRALFLDLDDTIFESNIPYSEFRELFDVLDEVNDSLPEELVEIVKSELFTKSFGEVSERYSFSQKMIDAYVEKLQSMEWKFDISPFPDYELIRTLPHSKYLVTSGSRSIQQAKVESLGISSDFEEICYDDPVHSSPGKQDLFHYLAKKYTLGRDEILIIGDNAESEIKAARQLGIQYVHIVRNSTTPYSPEQRMINSFTQLNYFL